MNREHVLYKEAIRGLLPDQEAIRKSVLARAKRYDIKPPAERKTKHRWLLPLAACIVALAVICIAVPPVRAAIEQWFSQNFSVGNYMAQPTDARPATTDIDKIIEQTMPENPKVTNSIEISNVVPEWQEWAGKLKPSVGDVFFDGKQLIVSFDMGGGAAELLMGGVAKQYPIELSMDNPGYIKLNGEKFACSASATPVESQMAEYQPYFAEDGTITDEGIRLLEEENSAKYTATIDLSRSVKNHSEAFEKWSEENKDFFLKEVEKMQQFDPDYTPLEFKTLPGEQLKGLQEVEVNIPLSATDTSKPSKVDETAIYFQSMPIGLIKLRFSFDPEAGYGSRQSYDINETVEWRGEGTYKWTDRDSDPEYVTFVNKTVDMTGVKMTAKRMDVNASGAELYVSITCPDSWDELDKQCFVSSIIPRTSGDGVVLESSGEQYGLEEEGEDLGMCIHLDMLPSEVEAVDTFEILPILCRFAGYDDVPYVEGEPTCIKKDDVKGWQEDSKELTDCVLRFSLK